MKNIKIIVTILLMGIFIIGCTDDRVDCGLRLSEMNDVAYIDYKSTDGDFVVHIPKTVHEQIDNPDHYFKLVYNKFKSIADDNGYNVNIPIDITISSIEGSMFAYSIDYIWGNKKGRFNYDPINFMEKKKNNKNPGKDFFQMMQIVTNKGHTNSNTKFEENILLHFGNGEQ